MSTQDGKERPTAPDSPARVLHVVGSMGLGGAETMLMNVYRTIDRQVLQFDFLVFGREVGAYESEITELGGRVLRADAPGARQRLGAVSVLAAVIREAGPFHAVHSHVNFASGWVLAAARRAGVERRVAHSHSTADPSLDVGRRVYRGLARGLLRRNATSLAACSEAAGGFLFAGLWDRDVVIRNSVDVRQFTDVAEEEVAAVREELGFPPGRLVLGMIGRLVAVKNHAFALEVLTSALGRGIDAALVVVGDGALGAPLEEEVHRVGLSDRVLFLGLRRDVPVLLQLFDVLLLPSLHEGIPLVLVEAQAAGLKVLVSSTVTRDVDLGLSLLDYLPISNALLWVEAIRCGRQMDRPSPSVIRAALAREGYDSSAAVQRFYELYGLSP